MESALKATREWTKQARLIGIQLVLLVSEFPIRHDDIHSFTTELYRIPLVVVKVFELRGTNQMEFAFNLQWWREVTNEMRRLFATRYLHRNGCPVFASLLIPVIEIVDSICRSDKRTVFDKTVVRMVKLGVVCAEEQLILELRQPP
jgi:hypothetical protein